MDPTGAPAERGRGSVCKEGPKWRRSETIQPAGKGTELFDTSEKVFPDVQAEPGESAYTFMHTVPYEGSVGLVNLLTTTRVQRKGFKTHLVLYGPGVLMASGSRGFPKVGDEAFPGHMAINNQLRTFLDEGGTVYACRFASGALYGFPENLLMEGVKPVPPARRARRGADGVARQGVPAQHLDRLTPDARCWTATTRSPPGGAPRRGSTRP